MLGHVPRRRVEVHVALVAGVNILEHLRCAQQRAAFVLGIDEEREVRPLRHELRIVLLALDQVVDPGHHHQQSVPGRMGSHTSARAESWLKRGSTLMNVHPRSRSSFQNRALIVDDDAQP
mgnify:CR=1 FL=1